MMRVGNKITKQGKTHGILSHVILSARDTISVILFVVERLN